jgi:peptidyl-prolyl isomerase H (cyclophilin H)
MDQTAEPELKRARAEPAAAAAGAEDAAAAPVLGVELEHSTHPVAFLDVTIGEGAAAATGRVKLELFSTITPRTGENFRQLCTGETQRDKLPAGYKGSLLHRVVPGFVVQGGDFVKGDGTGVWSVYNNGGCFADENFDRKHDRPGLLSMANSGPGRNGSQFFITLAPLPNLDGKHVVFGRVVAGMDVVRRVAAQATDGKQRPIKPCKISECGEL